MTTQPFNRTSFITLNSNRLFTAEQVADLIQEHTPHTPSTAPDKTESEIRNEILRAVESDEWQKEHDVTTRNQTLDDMDWGDIIRAIEKKGYTVKIRKQDAAIIRHQSTEATDR